MEASRVERHILYPTHPHYHMFDEYCFRAKNVYNQLQYKGEQHGIRVIVTEESYTSKCSFLDMEEIKKQNPYKGKRIKRGLFQSENGTFIHADVNGAYNMMRKVFPKAFANGIEGVGLHPIRVHVA